MAPVGIAVSSAAAVFAVSLSDPVVSCHSVNRLF